ncbi:MAG: DUF6079 family protein [Bacteroidales bacterium]
MKYKELIHFEPITSVVKLVGSEKKSVAENLVKTFVFSQKIKEDLLEIVLKNLSPTTNKEKKGIQIVGSYGTGKSHLMALVSAIAENQDFLPLLSDEDLKESFAKIAGKYKVLRFQIGTDRPLKDIVFAQFERFIESEGISYRFDQSSNFSWNEQILQMMAEFEEKIPDKHFLIVIDEMLEYLKGRNSTELSNDLMLLRQLGEACDISRFKIMFGVQELLYRSPEFQHQAEMLNKVEDRFDDLIITKEDVSFVVKQRLLKKDEHQKSAIREHMLKFAHLFEGINGNLNEYVDLFPVHPSYISYFEKIKHGKSQREILKVLSSNFEELMEQDVPADNPGLITYDMYWPDLAENPSMLTVPDIRTVRDKVEIIYDKIKVHFTGARENKRQLATSITNALAIKILCDDLDKRNGATVHSLKEDICLTLPGVEDPEFLLANIESTASHVVSATAGQYVDREQISSEFYIRVEGGINISQVIKDYADEVIKRNPDQADQYYFDFLQYVLALQQHTYRTGFKIWEDSLEWKDKKAFRLGYVFFGNPNERSTTEPIQQYYLFFCPVFNSIQRNDQSDEVYFDMAELSEEFKEVICLYGAAKAKEVTASTNQKKLFQDQIGNYLADAIKLFDKEYTSKTQVIYKGEIKMLKAFPLPGEGTTKDAIFRDVAARVLNKYFNDKFPDYPSFPDLLRPMTKDNFDGMIKNALVKIVKPSQPNRDGEAILSGLGLWNGQRIDTQHSKYADGIRKKMKERGEGKVLNRDEIIYPHYAQHNLWYSVDSKIDHQLQFLVLSAMVFAGDIELSWSNSRTLSASSIENLQMVVEEDMFTYQTIKEPRGIPAKHLKTLFECLGLPDLTTEIEKQDTVVRIVTRAQDMVKRVVETKAIVTAGLKCKSINLLKEQEEEDYKTKLQSLAELLDKIQTYNTYGKLKSFSYTSEELKETFKAYALNDSIEQMHALAEKFEKLVNYLSQALSYMIESEQPLYHDMTKAIGQLSEKLTSGNPTEIKQYETLLNSLKDRYAKYYHEYYLKCRLSNQDAMAKERILVSEKKKICDIVKDAEFLTATDYQNWINIITSLKEADPSLTLQKVKEEPYQDFNPREYYGKPNYKIQELEEQLDGILGKWILAMRSIFKDPSVKSNIELLKADERKLVEEFRDEKLELTIENAALLRNLISTLSKGIDKVEIALDDIKKQLNRPVTPSEAIDILTKYIDTLCVGKERNKVRIIIK